MPRIGGQFDTIVKFNKFEQRVNIIENNCIQIHCRAAVYYDSDKEERQKKIY